VFCENGSVVDCTDVTTMSTEENYLSDVTEVRISLIQLDNYLNVYFINVHFGFVFNVF